MKNIHLLLPVHERSVEWMRQILTMLVGGYDLSGYSLQPVFIELSKKTNEDAEKILEKVSVLIEHYRKAREMLLRLNSVFCSSEVCPPRLSQTTCDSLKNNNTFWLSQPTIQQTMLWSTAIQQYINSYYQEDDGLVVALYVEKDASDLSFIAAVLAALEACDCKKIEAVCELSSNLFLRSVHDFSMPIIDALRMLQEHCSLIVTGMRDDFHKRDFTCMQQSCAILDAMKSDIQGEPIIQGDTLDLCYSPTHLASMPSVLALFRMSLLEQLQINSYNKVLAQWRSKLRLSDRGNLWSEDVHFTSLYQLLNDMRLWQNNIAKSEMLFGVDDLVYEYAINKLNGVKCLSSTSTNEQRRREAMHTLLSTVMDAVNQIELQRRDNMVYRPLALSDMNKDWHYRFDELPVGLSPTLLFDITDCAFHSDYIVDYEARIWRSACLDFWELFFNTRKVQVEKQYTILEHRLSELVNKEEYRLLKLTPVGSNLLKDDIFYSIANAQGDFVAYSSPFTGFCAIKMQATSGVPQELNQRGVDFQQFIYTYVVILMKDAFSENFRQYVNTQITCAHQRCFQAHSIDFIRKYLCSCNEVGIEIIDNNIK